MYEVDLRGHAAKNNGHQGIFELHNICYEIVCKQNVLFGFTSRR